MTTATVWPDSVEPRSVRVGDGEYHRFYPCPDGKERPGVTTILLALGKSPLIVNWAAKEEKLATLETVAAVSEMYPGLSGQALVNQVVKAIGTTKAHRKKMEAAGNIGSQVHAMVQWSLHRELGTGGVGMLPPPMSEPAQLAFMAFEEWRKESELTPVRIEQTVWNDALDYAGTADTIWRRPDGLLVLGDLKSSKGIYDEQHIQVAAYVHAASEFATEFAEDGHFLLRVPKSLEDPLFSTGKPFEVRPLGQLYNNRTLTQEELMEVFRGCLTIWNRMARQKGGKDA